ncbi:helix-turn-helix family protein [Escherichia coli 2-210-07_S4_C1]|nr:helix-turn-helix family protein [Escherichia coli 2-210-07_S4_C1]
MFSVVYHPEVIKKSQKTPAKEIDLAKKRLAEVLNETGSHKELHNEWVQDDEYRAAWQEEERKEKLRALLAEWRKHDNLTKAQVAERIGVTPPVISRLENNITKASIHTLTRYAHACGIKKPVIALY